MESNELIGGAPLLPLDVTEQLSTLMAEKYTMFMAGRRFVIEAAKDLHRVTVKVTLTNEDESYFYPVYGRMNIDREDLKAEEAALFLVDYIDAYFEDFFEEGEDLYIPIEWAKYEYDATEFELKGQIFNLKAERLADELLSRSELN